VSTQLPLQSDSPVDAQSVVHRKPVDGRPAHTGVAPSQRMPHDPQVSEAPSRDSHPSAESSLQSAHPGSHASVQTPDAHATLA
jgi:hypothetical protein